MSPSNYRVRPNGIVTAAALALTALALAPLPATTALMPIEDVRAGMTGVGRTVFAGTELQEFKVHILGVLRNVQGPRRNLILAKLEGGPLADTGVAAGMSGSPVFIDGRLVGAVSYSIGSFPKEAIAGITPIGEMKDATGMARRAGTRQAADRTAAHPGAARGRADGELPSGSRHSHRGRPMCRSPAWRPTLARSSARCCARSRRRWS